MAGTKQQAGAHREPNILTISSSFQFSGRPLLTCVEEDEGAGEVAWRLCEDVDVAVFTEPRLAVAARPVAAVDRAWGGRNHRRTVVRRHLPRQQRSTCTRQQADMP